MIEDEKMEDVVGDGEMIGKNKADGSGDGNGASDDWGDENNFKSKITDFKLKEQESDEDEELAAAMAKQGEPETGDGEIEEDIEDGQIKEKADVQDEGEISDIETDQGEESPQTDAGDEEIADEEGRDGTEIEGCDGEAVEENRAGDGSEQGAAEDGRVVEENVEVTVETVVEAVLFASDEPLTPLRLANIVDSTVGNVKESVKNLNAKYKADNRAFRIERVAGGYQILTLSVYDVWLRKLVKDRGENKLSAAALETLAIIAYKQPIIRADIESIRGVVAGEMVRSLMSKGLVKIVGRAEILGRPMQYGTTKKFLETFGLNSLKDLPKNEELKKPNV
jgi:segregation and condensation protein B